LFGSILAGVPHLALRLGGAEALWERPLAVSPIPYGYLAGRAGLWCVGDQAAVIPSFTGDGMSIALHSASLAARMFLTGGSPEDYHLVLRRHLGGSMRLSTALSRLMVSAAGRALVPAALSLMPSSLRWIANATRIPAEELLHGAQATPADQESVLL
jgi:flavin-dependent dehydrogenase